MTTQPDAPKGSSVPSDNGKPTHAYGSRPFAGLRVPFDETRPSITQPEPHQLPYTLPEQQSMRPEDQGSDHPHSEQRSYSPPAPILEQSSLKQSSPAADVTTLLPNALEAIAAGEEDPQPSALKAQDGNINSVVNSLSATPRVAAESRTPAKKDDPNDAILPGGDETIYQAVQEQEQEQLATSGRDDVSASTSARAKEDDSSIVDSSGPLTGAPNNVASTVTQSFKGVSRGTLVATADSSAPPRKSPQPQAEKTSGQEQTSGRNAAVTSRKGDSTRPLHGTAEGSRSDSTKERSQKTSRDGGFFKTLKHGLKRGTSLKKSRS